MAHGQSTLPAKVMCGEESDHARDEADAGTGAVRLRPLH